MPYATNTIQLTKDYVKLVGCIKLLVTKKPWNKWKFINIVSLIGSRRTGKCELPQAMRVELDLRYFICTALETLDQLDHILSKSAH